MDLLQKLAEKAGISSSYIDKIGVQHDTPDSTRRFFLKAMGYEADNATAQERSLSQLNHTSVLPDVLTFYDNEKVEITPFGEGSYDLELLDENGISLWRKNVVGGVSFTISLQQTGYYTLRLYDAAKTTDSLLIYAPEKCYMPEWLKSGAHLSGVSVMLYSLRSVQSMGIGDFRDLKDIITLTAQSGGDVVGINPLGVMSPKMLPHPLFQMMKGDISPYRTLSRLFVNPVYLALSEEIDYQNSVAVAEFMNDMVIQNEMKRLKESSFVQYAAVMELKLRILERMYKTFKASASAERQTDFSAFKHEKGTVLKNLCLFEALLEIHKDETFWRLWQDGTGDITSAATQQYCDEHQERIDFYAYCHWLADRQLQKLQNYALSLGMKIGLYADMPIGAASNGAEVWENPSVYVLEAGIGAPADPMRPRGQSWGFTPYHPQILEKQKYAPFIQLVRENVNKAGALRIDHAMGLRRLFWGFFTPDNPVVQGAYVYYDMKALTAILTLESNRARCLLIGEDLGTVPEGFREYMAAHGLLSYKVFFRQKEKDGTFVRPEDYMYMSLAQSSTHDQATTVGFWLNEDIEVFKSCGLYVNEEQYINNLSGRRKDRENMIKALEKQGLINEKTRQEMVDSSAEGNIYPQGLAEAVNLFGAQTHSALYLVRLCDLCRQKVLDNAPGTIDEYPNWRIKLPLSLEEIIKSEAINADLRKIKNSRPK